MSTGMHGPVVVVGAGHAGGTVAALLRQYGWVGAITLVGAERRAPYQRPPLSKGLMLGKVAPDELQLKPDAFYAERQIALRLGREVLRIDRESRQVHLDGGEFLPYEHLVIATGARLRPLPVPGAGLAGVVSLRTADDAMRLREAVRPGTRVVVVGGGYIGLEAAASARSLGAEVCVLEREDRLMARVASRELAAFVAGYARGQGVAIELGASVVGFDGEAERVRAARLADGRVLPCDLALVGIGVLAEQSLAEQAGLACEDGIVVDEEARTGDPAVSAIGDCTRRPIALFERRARLESVHNAMEQAKQVAARLCGKPQPPAEAPWTWSDQFDLRLQIAGLTTPGDQVVVRGDPEGRAFAIFHLSPEGVLRAVEAVNSPMDFAFARMAIGKRMRTPGERLRDVAIPLKEVAIA
ncbi:FAD-dependent oxidoreductase [Hydrogenophaga sp.]|uniref:NAD(P)/FAD-dependent oxidoreductase n=1 Tax=Hydrogenophaga sp. TaxID=1904254 RepID=UPI00263503C5|nr:FAD-dependent oxidoreductase [Hydrogenophaga sp.]MCW5653164.1 FAD-dependent oxidoreductase [Hydrogenophaga sp.]